MHAPDWFMYVSKPDATYTGIVELKLFASMARPKVSSAACRQRPRCLRHVPIIRASAQAYSLPSHHVTVPLGIS